MRAKRIAILGAGGFAREVAWLIRDINQVQPTYEFLGYIVKDMSEIGARDVRDAVLGDDTWLNANYDKIDALAIGIGDPAVRMKLGDELGAQFPNIEWPALIHPSARYDESTCKIGCGAVVCAGVIATVNVTLARFAKVDVACTIGHEAFIGKACALNPDANIGGGVELGERVLIGSGVQVLQYLRIGAGTTVGAGAVVTGDIPPDQTVVGVPARPLLAKSKFSA